MVSPWFVTVTLGAIIIFILYFLSIWNNNYWTKRGVKYVYSAPLVGILQDLLLMRKGYTDIFLDIYKKYEGEKLVGYYQLITPSILVRDPELANQILVKDFSYFTDRNPALNGVDDLFSKSFHNYAGEEWKNTRAMLSPVFSSAKLKLMFESIRECSNELLIYLNDKTDLVFEARDLMQRVTFSIMARTSIGLRLNSLNAEDNESNDFIKYSSVFFTPSLMALMKFLFSFSAPWLREMIKLKLSSKEVDNYFRLLMKNAIKHRAAMDSKPNDFLQRFLNLKEKEIGSKPGNVGVNLIYYLPLKQVH